MLICIQFESSACPSHIQTISRSFCNGNPFTSERLELKCAGIITIVAKVDVRKYYVQTNIISTPKRVAILSFSILMIIIICTVGRNSEITVAAHAIILYHEHVSHKIGINCTYELVHMAACNQRIKFRKEIKILRTAEYILLSPYINGYRNILVLASVAVDPSIGDRAALNVGISYIASRNETYQTARINTTKINTIRSRSNENGA